MYYIITGYWQGNHGPYVTRSLAQWRTRKNARLAALHTVPRPGDAGEMYVVKAGEENPVAWIERSATGPVPDVTY